MSGRDEGRAWVVPWVAAATRRPAAGAVPTAPAGPAPVGAAHGGGGPYPPRGTCCSRLLRVCGASCDVVGVAAGGSVPLLRPGQLFPSLAACHPSPGMLLDVSGNGDIHGRGGDCQSSGHVAEGGEHAVAGRRLCWARGIGQSVGSGRRDSCHCRPHVPAAVQAARAPRGDALAAAAWGQWDGPVGPFAVPLHAAPAAVHGQGRGRGGHRAFAWLPPEGSYQLSAVDPPSCDSRCWGVCREHGGGAKVFTLLLLRRYFFVRDWRGGRVARTEHKHTCK